MLLRVILAAVSLLLLAGSPRAQTAQEPTATTKASQPGATDPADSMATPQTGDHWTYEFRDEITGDIKSTVTHTVTDVSGSEISIRVAVLGKPNFGYQTYDQSWNMIENGNWRFKPNDGGGVRLPLAVGKT